MCKLIKDIIKENSYTLWWKRIPFSGESLWSVFVNFVHDSRSSPCNSSAPPLSTAMNFSPRPVTSYSPRLPWRYLWGFQMNPMIGCSHIMMFQELEFYLGLPSIQIDCACFHFDILIFCFVELISIYHKRDYFNFHITNFLFLSNNIPSSPAYGVFISQFIRSARACSLCECFILRAKRLSSKLLKQGYLVERLK